VARSTHRWSASPRRWTLRPTTGSSKATRSRRWVLRTSLLLQPLVQYLFPLGWLIVRVGVAVVVGVVVLHADMSFFLSFAVRTGVKHGYPVLGCCCASACLSRLVDSQVALRFVCSYPSFCYRSAVLLRSPHTVSSRRFLHHPHQSYSLERHTHHMLPTTPALRHAASSPPSPPSTKTGSYPSDICCCNPDTLGSCPLFSWSPLFRARNGTRIRCGSNQSPFAPMLCPRVCFDA